jgi:hypothetical protein
MHKIYYNKQCKTISIKILKCEVKQLELYEKKNDKKEMLTILKHQL